jgi:hypothetical protein
MGRFNIGRMKPTKKKALKKYSDLQEENTQLLNTLKLILFHRMLGQRLDLSEAERMTDTSQMTLQVALHEVTGVYSLRLLHPEMPNPNVGD